MGYKSRRSMKLRFGSSANVSIPGSSGSGSLGTTGAGINTPSVRTRRRAGLTTLIPYIQAAKIDRKPHNGSDKHTGVIRYAPNGKPIRKLELCDICGRRFPDISMHIIYAHREKPLKPFACSQCNRSFRMSEGLELHVQAVHKPKKKSSPLQ
jgi:hypothetical protein